MIIGFRRALRIRFSKSVGFSLQGVYVVGEFRCWSYGYAHKVVEFIERKKQESMPVYLLQ